MTVTTKVVHPAKFTDSVLSELLKILNPILPAGSSILDPFAGVGGIHTLDSKYKTWGIEIEPEWADTHPRTIVGDALDLPFPDKFFDATVTSPCYGNRMADTYNGRGECRQCGGTGFLYRGTNLEVVCERCHGTGCDVSKRHTYRIALGRMPTDGSSSVMQWGDEYRDFHRKALGEMIRVSDLVVVNMSNHVRRKEIQHVVEWYVDTLLGFGCTNLGVHEVNTPRMRHGQNHDARVDSEHIIVMRPN